jgi:hypothetical protein
MPRDAGSHWKLEGPRQCSSLEPWDGAWSSQHLNFGSLLSKTVKEYISVILSYPVCVCVCVCVNS